MGSTICPCSRKTANLKTDDKVDEKLIVPINTIQDSRDKDTNKESLNLKDGQNNNNNVTWKYGSFDKSQQNDIKRDNNQNHFKSSKSGKKEMESFDELLKKKNNNKNENVDDNHSDSENEDNENSEISDLSNDENVTDSVNENNINETIPKTLPISTETILVSNAGFEPINGEYRWFMQLKKWCLFHENNSYCVENNIDVQNVYTQLLSLRSKNSNFRWDETIDTCWIIGDFEGNTIYYAAPQLNNNTIPNYQWISIHGNKPLPMLSLNSNPNACESKASNNNDHINNRIFGNSKNSQTNSAIKQTIYEEDDEINDEQDENEDSLSDIN